MIYIKSAATDHIRNNSNWICQKKCTYGCCFLPCKTHAVSFISRFLQWQQPSRTFTIVENASNIGSVSKKRKNNNQLEDILSCWLWKKIFKRNLLLSNSASFWCPFSSYVVINVIWKERILIKMKSNLIYVHKHYTEIYTVKNI